MIAKVARRGHGTVKLLRYLFGPGRANEHTDPHLVAAWDTEWLTNGAFAPLVDHGIRGALPRLARDIDAAMHGHQVTVADGHVYHVVLSVPPADSNADTGLIGDARWREYVESAIAHMGLGPDASGAGGCRWVAVHHGLSTEGNDHVHLVVNVVRGDGRIADLYRDFPRWRAWCRAVEDRDNLTRTAPAGEGRAQATTRPELERAARTGKPTERDELRRLVSAAATQALSELDFVGLLAEADILFAPRISDGNVVGYRVALRPPNDGQPFWIPGSALRRDLSLPRLRTQWLDEWPRHTAEAWTDSHPMDYMRLDRYPFYWRVGLDRLQKAETQLRLGNGPNNIQWHETVQQTANFVAMVLQVAVTAEQRRLLEVIHDQLTRAGQLPRGHRPMPASAIMSLIADAAQSVAACPDPMPAVLVVILLVVVAIVVGLDNHANNIQVRAAARQQIGNAKQAAEALMATVSPENPATENRRLAHPKPQQPTADASRPRNLWLTSRPVAYRPPPQTPSSRRTR